MTDEYKETNHEFERAEKGWQPPRARDIQYSTVSDEHKEAIERRKVGRNEKQRPSSKKRSHKKKAAK